MRKTRGFTLIEVLIVIAILGILLAITVPAITDQNTTRPETSCIGGMTFTNPYDSDEARQILDVEGKGIPCGANAERSSYNDSSYNNWE